MLMFNRKDLFYVVERGVLPPRISITCGHCYRNHKSPSRMEAGFIHTIDDPYHLSMLSVWKQAQEVVNEEGCFRQYHPEEICPHFINGKVEKVLERFIMARYSDFAITSDGYFAWFDKRDSDEAVLIPLANEDKQDVYLAFTEPFFPYYKPKLIEAISKYWTLVHQFIEIKKPLIINRDFSMEFKSHG